MITNDSHKVFYSCEENFFIKVFTYFMKFFFICEKKIFIEVSQNVRRILQKKIRKKMLIFLFFWFL